jgi:hypothetical protein
VNAVIDGAGGTGRLLMPQVSQPAGVFQLGFIGNVGLGAVGTLLTWGLYGPLALDPFARSARSHTRETHFKSCTERLRMEVRKAGPRCI